MPTSEIKSTTAKLRKPSTCLASSPPIASWYPGGSFFFRSSTFDCTGPMFTVVWLSSFNRTVISREHPREVVRMNRIRGGPTFQLLMGLAEIIQDSLIHEFVFPFRRHSIDKPW